MIVHGLTVDPQDVWVRLDASQRACLKLFEQELARLNARLNLVSRATVGSVHVRHTLHCLALACKTFPAGATVVDWGTGGGLPAIPLAIAFPGVSVIAVDASAKKILAVRRLARLLRLKNVIAWEGRAESWTGRSEYSVSRAAAPLATVWDWHMRVATPARKVRSHGVWIPGLLCLKGGDLKSEVRPLDVYSPRPNVQKIAIDHGEDKHIVHISQP